LTRRRAVSVVCAVALLGVVGCADRPKGDVPHHYGSKVNVRDFLQNTDKYKGKIVTLTLTVHEAIDRGQGKSLRDCIGRDVNFLTSGTNVVSLKVVIKIPEGVSVPEAGQSEEVRVTFLCTRGNLQQGNEAKFLEKSKP